MNLLFDKWLPVEAPEGEVTTIAPVDLPGSPFLRVAHARADYSALATELLIDIFQTLCAPASRLQCSEYVSQKKQPTPDQFEGLRAAFELVGDGPRFMQVAPFETKSASPASALFFEAPGANTVKLNKDLFVSRDAVSSLCLQCTPVALYQVQSHARMGGQGYCVGPRALSALAAIIEGATLWETVCLNLLPVGWFDSQTGLEGENAPSILDSFPWTNPKVSLREKVEKPLGEFGRFGVLWWTPLALHLHVTDNRDGKVCSGCGEIHPEHIESLSWKATASKLAGAIKHPRTGWRPDANKGVGRAIEVPNDGFSFEHWQALTIGARLEDSLPAWGQLNWHQAEKVRLRAFGFAMNQNSPVAWFDEVTPILVPHDPANRDALKTSAGELVTAAQKAVAALKASLFRDPKKGIDNPELPLVTSPTQAGQMLWDELGRAITTILRSITDTPITIDAATDFRRSACASALKIFDRVTVDYGDNAQVSRGVLSRRVNLSKKLNPKK
ncbi:type I-E CRISPR-associated protein Cse1/CasA [Paraburkholderia sp. UCT31]|uniref:type I-E CRISPR-associated protein Cse1/CasA n=1 Tax=Paraburkholderia sp. UCT31 TaxID=2615209 RepID=UPI001654D655|nr:type I-E CRISPR-associated protein Cse1/CasA [Paraburkholderia sp. UCT31]MBC8737221.1 type I-E CRISPR-associated protein Cse1/CasA [Paraburkholderia sp. UCT31]